MGGGEGGEVFMALYIRDSFAARNYKMGPVDRMVNLVTNLGHLGWCCWLVAFLSLEAMWAVGDGVGLASC